MKKCIKCGGETEGYKCNVCRAEADEHDSSHGQDETGRPKANHPRGNDHCMCQCVACREAEANCTCPPLKPSNAE